MFAGAATIAPKIYGSEPAANSPAGSHLDRGYELHITRAADHWSSNSGVEITLDEWRRYLQADTEFESTDAAEAVNPITHEVIRIEQRGIARWMQHSSRDAVWFAWSRGNVSVKNPDDEVIRKMHQVASHLRADVQGDDGEWYDGGLEGEPTEHAASSKGDEPLSRLSGRKPWWRLW